MSIPTRNLSSSLFLVLALLAGVTALSACGGGGGGASSTPASTPAWVGKWFNTSFDGAAVKYEEENALLVLNETTYENYWVVLTGMGEDDTRNGCLEKGTLSVSGNTLTFTITELQEGSPGWCNMAIGQSYAAQFTLSNADQNIALVQSGGLLSEWKRSEPWSGAFNGTWRSATNGSGFVFGTDGSFTQDYTNSGAACHVSGRYFSVDGWMAWIGTPAGAGCVFMGTNVNLAGISITQLGGATGMTFTWYYDNTMGVYTKQ